MWAPSDRRANGGRPVGIARLVRFKEYQATCIRSYFPHYVRMTSITAVASRCTALCSAPQSQPTLRSYASITVCGQQAIMQGSAKTEADLAKASGDNKLLRLFFG